MIKIATWDYIQPSVQTNGKKAGLAYCGWTDGENEWDANGYILSDNTLRQYTLACACRYLNPTDYPTWTISFEIFRTTVSADNYLLMQMENQLWVGTNIAWSATGDQVYNTSLGLVDGLLGSLAVNTWGTITIRYVYATGKSYYKLNDGDEIECDARVPQYSSGFYFRYFEGTCRIRNILLHIDRPVNTGLDYLMKLDGFPDDYLTSNNNNTWDTYLIDGTAQHKVTTIAGIKCLAQYTFSAVLRLPCWAFTTTRTHKFKLRMDDTVSFRIGYYHGESGTNSIINVEGGYFCENTTTDRIQIDSGDVPYSVDTWYDIEWEVDIPNSRSRMKIDGGNWSDYWTISAMTYTPVSMYLYGNGAWNIGNVTVDDGLPWTTPTIDSPADIEMTEGDAETITWSVTGDGGDYSIEVNGVEADSGTWVADGDTIEFDCSALSVDDYDIECIITDDVDIESDIVNVIVSSGYTPSVVDASGAISESGSNNVIQKRSPMRMNELSKEPDNIIRNYKKWRKKW